MTAADDLKPMLLDTVLIAFVNAFTFVQFTALMQALVWFLSVVLLLVRLYFVVKNKGKEPL